MADVNNKLRLQIVTQLDAAGIKATKDQVDQLELGLRRAGKSGEEATGGIGGFEKSLGRLPGVFGKIQGAMSGTLAKASSFVGALTIGVEIGNKIVEFQKKIGLFPGAFDDSAKAAKRYDAELENLKATLDAVVAAEKKHAEAVNEAAEKSIKAIDNETAAYFRQASALERLRKGGASAESMQLERAKFEEMKAYSDSGYAEAAEQIGKYYDVLQADLEAKEKIAEFDRESVRLAKDQQGAEEAYSLAAERAAKAKSRQVDAEAALARFREERSVNGWYTNGKDEARDAALEKLAEGAKKDAEKAAAVLVEREKKLDQVDANNLARQMERANLVASGTLGVDRAAQAYDDFVVANNNPLNATIDRTWADDLLRETQDSDRVQKEILEQVKGFGDRLEKLLELK